MSIEQLQRFCSDEEGRPAIQKPYTCEDAGETWSIGTDGRRMLAIRGCIVEPRKDAPESSHILRMMEVGRPLGSVDLAALAAFCGAPPDVRVCTACKNGRIRCVECDGDGEEECECECGHHHTKVCFACRGKGDMACPECRGWRTPVLAGCRVRIGEAVFDRAIVATCLVDAERTTGVATLVQDGKTGMCTLSGDRWRLMFMPLRDDPEFPKSDLPAFPLAVETTT